MRRNRIREEALAWLARLKRGLRPDEGPQLLTWLKRRSHRRLIAKAAVEWHGPEVLAVLSEIFPIDPAILEPRRGTPVAVRIAAALASPGIALLVVGLILVRLKLTHGSHLDGWFTTTPNATQRLSLEDGTRVALNRGTGINVLYMEHNRIVFVARGEAIFEVANAPHRPFTVRAAGRVFETDFATFDIRLAGPDRLSLTVLKGTVTSFPAPPRRWPDGSVERVSDPMRTHPILLEPLQMLTIEPDEESGQTVTEKELRSRLSWRGGT